jgi:branched-chain amino acid transport system substrate-binding protein
MVAALSVDTVGETLARRWGMESEPHRTNLRVAILHEDGLYGSTVGALQLARCKERRLNAIEKLSYSAASPDLGNAVKRFRGADATVVLHTGYQSDTVMFYRQMKEAGWLPRMVIGSGGGYALVDTATTIGADFDGTLNVGFPPYGINPDVAPGLHEIEAAYERKYGTKPRSGHSLANYVGAKLFFDALLRAGSLDKDKVRDAVQASDVPLDHTANSWGARFDDKGQNTLALPVVAQWHGSVLRTVQPSEASVAPLRPQLGS